MFNQTLYRGFIVACLLLLAGCSTFTELTSDLKDKVLGKDPPNPPAALEEIKPTYNAKVDWSSQIGDTGTYDFTPVLEAGMVYAANSKGELVKLDATNGRQEWRVNAGEPISGGVGAGGGIILVGTSRGNVLAYDVSGKLLWKSKVSSEVLSAPRYFDGFVIARSGDNHIFGLDSVDGSRKWVYERVTPALSLRSSAGIVVDGGAVYAGFSGGKMVALRADNGKLLWEATVAQPRGVTEIERIADITSLPTVVGPAVFAVAYQGRTAAIDRLNGKVAWNRDISSYTGLNFENDRLYLSHSLGSVYALDYAAGKTFWRQPALLNRQLTVPQPLGDVVAVGDLEGYVHFLNRDDGNFAARIKIDGDPVMSIISGNTTSQVIATTRGGGLYAVSVASNGSAITRSQSAPSKTESAPIAEPEKPAASTVREQSSSDLEKTIIETTQPVAESAKDTAIEPTPAEAGGANTDSIMFKKDQPDAGSVDKLYEPGSGN